jgi:signal transduction histidine kinase
MELRKRLTILFLLLIASIIITSSVVVYFWFAEYRKTEFYDRLSKKARSVAELLVDFEEIDAKLLKKIEDTKPVSLTSEKIIIYNFENEIIYNHPDTSFSVSKENLDKIRREEKLEYVENNHEVYALYYKGKNESVVVAIAAKDTFGLTKLNKLRMILILVSLFSIILVYFSGRFFTAKALNPVTTIIKQVDNISISNLDQRLYEGNKKDEIARLAITFNKMLSRLETAIMMQKVFIANASHELRSPLTVITGQLEIALIKERPNEDYAKIIRSVLDDIINVNQLANRLLLIAQTNTNFSSIELSRVRLDDIIWDARQEIRRRNSNYSIKVYFGNSIEDLDKLMIMGNSLLLKTAINNLIENACKYSSDHQVKILIEVLLDKVFIHFTDNGLGITPDDMNMIFEPFYRGRNTTGIQGHGIGLSLVQNIIKSHKGEIQVMSQINKGSEFTVILPLYGNN